MLFRSTVTAAPRTGGVSYSTLSTWLPLEYDLQYTYGAEQVAFSPWLWELKQAVDRRTTEKIEQAHLECLEAGTEKEQEE